MKIIPMCIIYYLKSFRLLRLSHRTLFFCTMFALMSCGNNQDLKQYIKDVKLRPFQKKLPPLPRMLPVADYTFPDTARRNPFLPEMPNKAQNLLTPDFKRIKQPLEYFALDALAYVGTLQADNVVWALIQTPDDTVAQVKKGDYLGKNFGKIMKITDKSVTLEELYQSEGRWSQRNTVIKLHTSTF